MASAAVLARIRSLAPEFASLSDSDLNQRADSAGPYLSTAVYPPSVLTGQTSAGVALSIYDEAQALWSCHMLTRVPVAAYDAGGGGGGSALLVTQDTTGDLSQNYGFPATFKASPSDMDYTTTHYGIGLMRLRGTRATFAVPLVV